MTLRETNLADLVRSYYMDSKASFVAEDLKTMVREGKHAQLAVLLRDHQDREVDDWREIEFRSAVDRLLTCYSILEIASLVDFVPSWTSSEFAKDAVLILNNEQLQRFYESYYPSWLVVLFKRRLLRGSGTVLYADDQLRRPICSGAHRAGSTLSQATRGRRSSHVARCFPLRGSLLPVVCGPHWSACRVYGSCDERRWQDRHQRRYPPGLKEDQILTQAAISSATSYSFDRFEKSLIGQQRSRYCDLSSGPTMHTGFGSLGQRSTRI